jgi:hypothetical protein
LIQKKAAKRLVVQRYRRATEVDSIHSVGSQVWHTSRIDVGRH